MRRTLWLGLIIILLMGVVHEVYAQSLESACNPQPEAQDLVLSGPNNTTFVFRSICVHGEGPLSGTTFVMGDADSDDFRTAPTRVMIGGSFPAEEMWKYYLGKYEVSRAQYRAVMGSLPVALAAKNPPESEDNFPVTNLTYFEAISFIDTLNTWLFINALDELPTSGVYPGFIRLPSEVEWEFAARGGITVPKSVFESPLPYSEQLSAHEWFGGAKSSHGKMKAIGLLKPNPLGLHDMLGNVQEMTSTPYQLEYYQGRSGGFVSRGGSFIANEDVLNVAQRQEEPFYLARRNKVAPNAKITMGLRLAIAAPIFTDREAIADLEDAWEEHRTGSGSASPAVLSVAPVSNQEGVSVNNALERLRKLRASPADEAVKILGQELAYAEAALRTTLDIRRKADADAAKVWLGQALFLGQTVQQYLARYHILATRVAAKQGEPDLGVWQARLDDAHYVVTKTLERYSDTIASLANIPADLVPDAFNARKTEESEKLNKQELSHEAYQVSLQTLECIQKHYDQYYKSKRSNPTQWRDDYTKLSNY